MSEFIEIQSLMKEIHWGRLLGLWAAFLCVLAPEAATFAMLLSLAAVSDIRSRVVPNTVCLAIAGLGCIDMVALSENVKWRIINVLAVLLLLLLIKALFRQGIGMGDVKLLLASSFMVDIFSLALGMLLGCVLAAGAGIFRFRSLKGSVPLVPFLTAGIVITYFV